MNDSGNVRIGWVLVATIAASFFFNLWGTPLFDVDEGAFGEATREMFQRGDFISTYLNGEPRNDKPILIYWLQAVSIALFGINEVAFRLPSAIAASAWVLMVFYFVRKIADSHKALVAAVVTATCLEVSVIGKAATADALLNLCITASMLLYYLHYRFREQKFLYLCFMFIGLGFLTKGPVAVMIPGVVSLLFCLSRRDIRFWLHSVFNPPGILIFLVVALPWYVVSYFHDGGEFIRGFLFRHNLGRFDNVMESHSGGIFYYVPVALLGVLPYTTALLLVLRRISQLWRDDLSRYLLLWFGFVFVFFSFSGTKLPHYLIYGMTAMAILMAFNLDQLRNRWLAFLPAFLFLSMLFLLPEILEYLRLHSADAYTRELLANHQHDTGHYRWVVAAGLLALAWLLYDRRWQLQSRLLASGMVTVLVVAGGLMPVLGRIQQQPVKDAALWAKKHGVDVIQWRLRVPSFNVYSRSVSPQRLPQAGDYVLTRTTHLDTLPPFRIMYSKNGLVLVRLDADNQ